MLDREGVSLIRSYNYHLRAAKRTAELKKSDVLNNILFIPEKNDSVKPFYKLLKEALQETKSFRKQDNRNQNHLSDYRSKIIRSQNYLGRKSSIANISKEKKHILISSVRSFNSHPDLLLIHQHPLFQITPVLNTGLSLSELLHLYKGYKAI